MRIQEHLDCFRLVRRQVVDNHVDLASSMRRHDIAEKRDECGARVPGHRLADDLSGLRIQCRVERQCAVAEIFEPVTFGTAWRQRQHRIQPIQRLDGGLLIRGKDDRVLRRIQIQTDHVGGLFFELRIVREHVALEPVRLIPRAAPDASHEHVADAQHLPQLARRPVRAAIGRFLPRLRQNARFERRCAHGGRLAPILRPQSRKTLHFEPLLPASDVRGIAADGLRNRGERLAVREHQNDLRAARVFCPNLAAARATFQFSAFIDRQRECHMALQHTTIDSVVTVH